MQIVRHTWRKGQKTNRTISQLVPSDVSRNREHVVLDLFSLNMGKNPRVSLVNLWDQVRPIRGLFLVSRTTSPCVHPRSPRVYIQNVSVCTGNTRTCFSTCARVAGILGDVLNVHMVGVLNLHTGPHRAHTHHDHDHNHSHSCNDTHRRPQPQTPHALPHTEHHAQHHTQTDRERQRKKTEREDKTKEKTRQETRRQDKRR